MHQDKVDLTINISPGEIVQVFNATPETCMIKMNSPHKIRRASVHPDLRLSSSSQWPVAATDTTRSLLERWLADVPVVSVQNVLEDFGLENVAHIPIRKSDTDTRFRLNTLKAILTGADVIQLVSPWKISDCTDFILNALDFATEQSEYHHGNAPAFAVFDGDAVPGITLIADQVCTVSENQIREMSVVY